MNEFFIVSFDKYYVIYSGPGFIRETDSTGDSDGSEGQGENREGARGCESQLSHLEQSEKSSWRKWHLNRGLKKD